MVFGSNATPANFRESDERPDPALASEIQPTAAEKAASNALTIENPKWAHRPTLSDILYAYPTVAFRAHRSGQVSVNCVVQADGAFKTCRIVEENPKRYNFGWVALALAFKFRMEPKLEDGSSVEGRNATVRINFRTDTN